VRAPMPATRSTGARTKYCAALDSTLVFLNRSYPHAGSGAESSQNEEA
jgi:hypothetical protein